MKEELKELVSKHLPSLAAGEMSKYIEQAEKDKETLKKLTEDLASISSSLLEVKKELEVYKTKDSELKAKGISINIKEKDLKEKEINLKVAELTYKLEQNEKSKLDIFNLVNTFVANPRAIEMISKNTSYNTMDYWNNNHNEKYLVGKSETGHIEKKEQK